MKSFHALFNEILGSVSGKEVAEILGKTPSFVSQIRKGQQIPRDELICALAMKLAPGRLAELLLAAARDRLEKQPFEAEGRKRAALDAMDALGRLVADGRREPPKTAGRTFRDFPDAFYPLIVVTGDKREDRGTHLSPADFGTYSATPADTRWLCNLALRSDVVNHVDKGFLLFDQARLIERFATSHLLVVGSPAANHLARIVNRGATFRFNYGGDVEKAIEETIDRARGLSKTQLAAHQEKSQAVLTARMRSLFTGGIFDPTRAGEYVRAKYSQVAGQTHLDFGVLTFAANPFYELKCRRDGRPNDHRFVAILAAGIHHPATAHAVRLLGRTMRDNGVFAKHPYGGVLRVTLDPNVPFAERTEQAEWTWEDRADPPRSQVEDRRKELLDQLEAIRVKLGKGELKHVEITAEQAAACRRLIECL